MKHRASSTRTIDAPDRHSGQTNKLTCVFVNLFVCLCLTWSLTLNVFDVCFFADFQILFRIFWVSGLLANFAKQGIGLLGVQLSVGEWTPPVKGDLNKSLVDLLVLPSFKRSTIYAAELYQLPQLRSEMHCLSESSQHHPSTRSSTIWRPFCSSRRSVVSNLMNLLVSSLRPL